MKVLRFSAIAAVAIFAAACGDKVTVPAPITLTTTTTTTTTPVTPGKVNSISIAPATATLTVGQTIGMTAAVNADPGVATTVTWSASDTTKVKVTAAGVASAVAATPGVAICATSTVNTGVKGCASIVVTAPPVTPAPKVNSITITPAAASLTVGQTVVLTATVSADSGVATTVTWLSADTTKVTVSTAGLVSAVAVSPGVAVCATSTFNKTITSCASIVVTALPTPPAPKVNSVTITPATASLTIGQTTVLTAVVSADSGVATTVTWSSADTTKVTVSTAGLVTAVAATSGVAVCATSTANTGVRSCASVIVSSAPVVVPATASIAGVFTGNLSTPITPSNVTGNVFVQVNLSPGTEVIQKVYLLFGATVVDSQVFTSAQSAALRYAADNAGVANDVAQPTIILTANTADYNTTTGAVTYANATGVGLSVQVYVVGSTAVRSTATYASTLTLNNADAIYGTYTLPSTKVTATDAAGYQWTSFGGGSATLNVVPVLYSGKTVASATVKYPNMSATWLAMPYCDITGVDNTGCTVLPTTADTAVNKTVTATGAFTITVGLYDREYTGALASPATPTISLVYTNGSSTADGAFATSSLPALALRIDNKGPAAPAISAPQFSSSTSALRPVVSFAVRPTLNAISTAADSGKLITAVPADAGVSSGATLTSLNGLTFKAFQNAGGTGTTATDTLPTYGATAITSNLVGYSEAGAFCFRLKAYDALGNASPNYKDGQIKSGAITTRSCSGGASAGSGQISAKVDGTAPVTAFSGMSAGDWSANDTATGTAFTAGTVNYFYTVTDANAGTDSISVCYYQNVASVMTANEYIGGGAATACSRRIKGTGTGTNKAITTATAQLNQITSAGTLGGNPGQIVITSQHYDAAGNTGNKITRIVLFDATAPTTSAATVPSVVLGDAPSIASFLNDGMSIASYAAEIGNNTSFAYASNIASHVGTFTTGEAAAKEPILRTAYTATTDLITTTPYTKFLNQSISVTTPAIQYLIRWGAAATGSVSEQADALLAASTGYRIMALDQAGNRTLGGTLAAPSITNLFNAAALAGTATSPLAGASGAVTVVALDGAFTYNTDFAASASAVSGGRVLSSTVRVKVSYYTKHDQTSSFFNNKVSATGWVYCTGRTGATGGSPLMNGASAVSESVPIQSVTAPAVSLYFPVRGGGANQVTMQYVGDASVLSSTTVTGVPKNNCGDVVTSTYAITVTPTDRTYQNWTSGAALWVVRHPNGFASVLPMGVGFSR